MKSGLYITGTSPQSCLDYIIKNIIFCRLAIFNLPTLSASVRRFGFKSSKNLLIFFYLPTLLKKPAWRQTGRANIYTILL